MVAVAIFSMMMAITGVILRNGEAQSRLADMKINLEESVRESIYQMSLEVRESASSRVSVLNSGALLSFSIPASVSNSGSITWTNPITYQVGGNGTQLVRTDTGTGQVAVLANDIQSVTFGTNGSPAGTVTFAVTASRTLPNSRVLTLTSTGEAKLRNS